MAQLWPPFTKTYHNDQYAAIDPTTAALDCSGKIVIVTGAGRGIGRAIAKAFGQAHAEGVILLGGRTRSTLDSSAEEIEQASSGRTKTFIAECDITDAAQVQRGMDAAVAHFDGRAPHVLVNNVGVSPGAGGVEKVEMDNLMYSLDVNVRGSLLLLQAFLRACRREDESKISPETAAGLKNDQMSPRAVINISSGAAHVPYAPGVVAYAASKAAGVKIIEYLHHERPTWRVFNVQPGVVATELAKKAGRKAPDSAELPAGFSVWLATSPDVEFLSGRFVWANWDVTELLAMRDEIVKKDLLRMMLRGWADGTSIEELERRMRSVSRHTD